MSFFSKVKRAAASATRAPLKITRVAPKIVRLSPTALVAQRAFRAVATGQRTSARPTRLPQRQTAGAYSIANPRVQALAKQYQAAHPGSKLARASNGSIIDSATGQVVNLDAQPGGFFSRMKNAITSPSAATPSSSGNAGASAPGDPYAGQGGAYDSRGGGNDEDAGDGGYDDGSQANSPDTSPFSDDDPTADMPDGFLDERDEPEQNDMGNLGEIDYHAALAGWQDDLKTFGANVAKTSAQQALTQIGNKLTKGATVPKPPPPRSAGMSTGAKVAIGAGVVVVGGLLISRMRHRAPIAA